MLQVDQTNKQETVEEIYNNIWSIRRC